MRVFVSSTFEDLREYREAAFKAIHSLGGYSDDMVYWSSDERSPDLVSVDKVKNCDVLILLLAHRYGYIPPENELSITEMEYQAARQSDVPVLAFFLDEEAPWPPKYIEWEQQENLRRFKKLVEADVVRKNFSSPDELNSLVTQAIALFMDRHAETIRKRDHIGTTLIVDPATKLESEPDLVVQVGQAEDGVPWLLEIKRTQDLDYHLNALAEMVSSTHQEEPRALIESFRQALEQNAVEYWASQRIIQVETSDHVQEKMYVTDKNLSQLTSSLFARIIDRKPGRQHPVEDASEPTLAEAAFAKMDSAPSSILQSVGGTNRFLGISVVDGSLYSVGYQSNRWVVWRPFLSESIPATFTEGSFEILAGNMKKEGALSDYLEAVQDFAIEYADHNGFIEASVGFELPTQSIGQIISTIARSLDSLHSEERIHGDLKPQNILLTGKRPALIDQFDLSVGERAPGWTLNWSAPEQVMTEPLTCASDIYPLGIMLCYLLGGILVGEVRKFKIPPLLSGRDEYDLLFNPQAHIKPSSGITKGNLSEWISFINSCLKFDPAERPNSAAAFADRLDYLLDSFPLSGTASVYFDEPLVVATLLDGRISVARVIHDVPEQQQRGTAPMPIPLPQPAIYPRDGATQEAFL